MAIDTSEIPDLDTPGLRRFGLTTGAIVSTIFGILFPYIFDRAWPLWPWIFAGALTIWALAAPATLGPVYRGWMRFGLVASKVVTPVILTLVYVVTFIPTSIILSLIGKDMMRRKFDEAPSYRIQSKQPSTSNMEKPY
jgi:O-antigen/teichoic acid export membrane protein